MIEGAVNAAYEAALLLTVHGPEGHPREIEAVVDTGYNGFLTLPPVLMVELDLPFVTSGEATPADGNTISFDIHMVTVDWDGQARHIEADAAETTPSDRVSPAPRGHGIRDGAPSDTHRLEPVSASQAEAGSKTVPPPPPLGPGRRPGT